ncbi:zinc finger protein 1035 [Anabas testudineus]|uniref:zinc finger protein 1035 n=1 Tax=Anabas testudineus TaxID=64144 RepID=UPI000E4566C9|nr:zinc finger protein 1035 [Anabas testudineus]
MAHGWDSYYENLSSDPRTLRRTSQSEGSFSQHIENFIGHHDFTNTVAPHEPQTTTSNFNTNCYSNPSIGNSSSDCVYQRYYTETPWQADGEQMEKDYLPQCGNTDMSDFTSDGLPPSGSFPSSFATDLQGIKQDCAMLTTSFLENYSDVSSSSDADVGETRPSCKFMANNSVQKLKTDVSTKHSLSEWLFSDTGTMTFPSESQPPNVAQTNVSVSSASNVKVGENIVKCSQDEMENPEQNVRSHTGHDQSSVTPNVVTTTGSETDKDRNNSDGCEDQKQKENVERGITQGKHPVMTISGHENLTEDRLEDYPYGTCQSSDPLDIKVSGFKDANHELSISTGTSKNSHNLDSNLQFYKSVPQDNICSSSTVMCEHHLSDASDENKESVETESCIEPNSSNEKDWTSTGEKTNSSSLNTDKNPCLQKEMLKRKSPSSSTDPDCNCPGVTSDGFSLDKSEENELTKLCGHSELVLQPDSSNIDIGPCLENDRTSTGERKMTSSPECSDSRVPGDGLFTDTSDMNKQNVSDHPEFGLQTDNSSTNKTTCLEKDLTNTEEKTSNLSLGPDTSRSTITSDSLSTNTNDENKQRVPAHPESDLQTERSNTDRTPCLKNEWTDPTESPNGCSDLVVASDSSKHSVSSNAESSLQPSNSNTNISAWLEKEITNPPDREPTTVSTENRNLDVDDGENARESFEELDSSKEEQSVLGMLYGEPLSREDSLCDTDETNLDASQYKKTSEARREMNSLEKSGKAPLLKDSTQMRKRLQPVVILKALESVNGTSGSYYCADCKHTTHSVDNLIEHHHCSHSVHNFQFCKTCNLYLMRNEQTEKHLCGKNEENPQLSTDSSLKKTRHQGHHKCNRCGLIFSKVVLYIRHMRTHTGKTPFKCSKCGLYFAQSCTLQRHLRIPGRCKQAKLPATTSDAVTSKIKSPPQKELTQSGPCANLPECYVRLVDISKTNQCSLCGKSFLNAEETKKHMDNIHTKKNSAVSPDQFSTKPSGEETPNEDSEIKAKYKCPLCPRLFKYSYNRARHLRDCVRDSIYGGKGKVDGKYRCPLCNTLFTLSSNRYRHVKALCLKECLSRLAKQKTNPGINVEQKETEPKTEPKESQQKKQAPVTGADPKTFPRYKCNLCPAAFCHPSGKYKHMKKHELFKLTGKMFRYRNSVFSTRPGILTSAKNLRNMDNVIPADSNDGLVLKCNFCEKGFSTSQSLKKHEHSHRGERPYRCLDCGKGFKKRAHLFGHKIVHQRRIQCTVCRKILPTVGELIQHRSTHLKRGMLQCPDCHLQFQYPVYLLRHLDAHKNRENKAPQLEERTPLKPHQSLESVKEQSGLKQLQCSLCKEVFDDAQVLRKHCLTHISGSSSHQCPFCKHNFNNRRYLLRHMIKHTGDKPYSCENCGKQFYRDLYLKLHNERCLPAQPRHVTVKSDTKTKRPYNCLYCPRSFCKKNRLKNHHHAHKVNSLLLCSRCGQYFGFRKLNQHQKNCGEMTDLINGSHNGTSQINQNGNTIPVQSSTTNMLKFKCPHCPQRFRYRSLFFRHLVSHTGVQPYVCMHCGQRFGTQTMCLQHEAFCDGVYKERPSKVKSPASTKLPNMPTLRESTQKPQAEGEAEYKCKFCTKTFMKSRNLRHHILTHNEVKPYRCKACDSCFSRYDHLKVHQTRCRGRKTRLEVCIPKISLDDVGRGWQSKYGTEPAKKEETFECEVCLKRFPTQSKLSQHVTVFHSAKLFNCASCGSSFAHERSLKKHKKLNRCRSISNEADASTPQETNPPTENLAKPLNVLKSRILQRITPCFNKKYKYVCSYCPRAFGNSWQLGVHTRLHTGEKPYACEYCGQRFIRKDYVQRHHAKCTKKQQSQAFCEKCGGFFSDIKLENHKKNCTSSPSMSKSTACQGHQSTSESPPKGFSCAYCSSRFLLFSQLQEHFLNAHKLETNVQPVSTAPLQHHLSNIPNIKEEPLDESCDKGRDEGANLMCNFSTALDGGITQQFFCPECKISFTRKSALAAHLRGHQMRYPFKCKTCKKGFWNKTLLRNHLRKCRFGHDSRRNATKMLEVPLKAELDFALDDSETTGTGVLQTNLSCKDDSVNKSPQNSEAALVQSSSSKEKKAVQYQCSECDKSFTDGLLLISHLEDHGRQEQEKKRNTCSKCGRVCASHGHLENHMKIHGIEKKYPCPDCSKMVYSSSDLEIHRTCHDPNRPFACKLCNQRFWTRPSLCNHYTEDHPDDVFSCRFCNKAYSVKKSLARHYRKWHQKEQKDLGNTVQERGSTEQQPSSLHSTMGESDEDENNGSEDSDSDSAPYFPCHVCGKTFPTSESLEDHQRCHLGEKPHECEECGKCFFQASQLQQHQRMHQSEFQCQACGRGFMSLFALRKHKHTHGKSRPYRCSKCHLSFTGPSQLAEHMFTHREENFPCDICNRVFLSKSSRAEHRKCHSRSDQRSLSVSAEEHEKSPSLSSVFTKELKYRCGVCGDRFRDPEELSEHGCMAAKERLYSCSDCDKHFLHASHLKKHRTTHHLSRSEYPCNKCKNSFSSSQHFLNHLKAHVDTAGEIEVKMENKEQELSNSFICPVCHLCFSSATELSCHFPTHLDGTFKCKVCKMTFPNKGKLDEHERCHLTSSTEFECTECGQSFLGSDAFRQHDCPHQKHAVLKKNNTNLIAKSSLSTYQAGEEEEVDVTGEDLYNCLLCSMQFSSKSSLLEHQNKQHQNKQHQNEKPFKCELCGKAFALRRYLKEHERRHRTKETARDSQSPEKRFRCTQCHTRFNTAQDLSVHMRLHAEKDVGQFRCDMCYKSFTQWQLLKLHQESHVGEVVYECTECDKAFAFPHLLEEHQQTHAGSSH